MSEKSALHHQIEEAVEPVSQFWPMKSFVHHNPIHGLEHLPFDEAIREAKHLFGAEGYLPNDEYRGFYYAGRIQERSRRSSARHVGPKADASISLASRDRYGSRGAAIHFLHGIDALEPALFDWQFASAGALSQHVRSRYGRSILTSSGERRCSLLISSIPESARNDRCLAKVSNRHPELPFRRALSDWLDELTGSSDRHDHRRAHD